MLEHDHVAALFHVAQIFPVCSHNVRLSSHWIKSARHSHLAVALSEYVRTIRYQGIITESHTGCIRRKGFTCPDRWYKNSIMQLSEIVEGSLIRSCSLADRRIQDSKSVGSEIPAPTGGVLSQPMYVLSRSYVVTGRSSGEVAGRDSPINGSSAYKTRD
jgi:hypothetical protein